MCQESAGPERGCPREIDNIWQGGEGEGGGREMDE